MRHVVVYRDPSEYNGFPSIARLHGGDPLVGFRRAGATSARAAQSSKYTHIDPESQAVTIRSTDGGETWDPATLAILHDLRPGYGMQDASVSQLSDGTVISGFFGWQVLPLDQKDRLDAPPTWEDEGFGWAATQVGAFTVRSSDGGYTWEKELAGIDLSPLEDSRFASVRNPVLELPDGTLLLAVQVNPPQGRGLYSSYVARSRDGGQTWGDPSPLALDDEKRVSFGEVGLLHLDGSRLLAMARTSGAEGHLYQCESDDYGYTWSTPCPTPMWGHPAHLLRLQDGRILCTYGYRREPFGVRACLSRDEGKTWDMAQEVVLRADGTMRDLGYPSSLQMDDGTILSVYYIHDRDMVRFIAGTFWQA